jgi:cysteine synthase A
MTRKSKIVAVEPSESAVLAGGPAGAHDIEGIGVGYTPPLWDPGVVDEVLSVETDDAKEMARQMVRQDGIFAGTSSGGNVVPPFGSRGSSDPTPTWSP